MGLTGAGDRQVGVQNRRSIRMQPGYDHPYFFMTSFFADHAAFHTPRLKGPGFS